jgi:(E)-4-hydroxy-3-methylbut-2-enyl-diphosphate synthase
MRIGTNHGSLSDRIMSRYGDTAIGMVESAMEFLRIAESENYYNIVLSMKSSNPIVMVEAYRLLIKNMDEELGHCYPLHLGVTEAGDGEDGRIKSAIGIGTLLEDGIGDTIRVSLTEDSELELPVCRDIIKRYEFIQPSNVPDINDPSFLMKDITDRNIRETFPIQNIGGKNVPVVIANYSNNEVINPNNLTSVGYQYNALTDKWNIGDLATDYIYCGDNIVDFALPGTLKLIYNLKTWESVNNKRKSYPLLTEQEYLDSTIQKSPLMNFVVVDCYSEHSPTLEKQKLFDQLSHDFTAVVCLHTSNQNAVQSIRRMFVEFNEQHIKNPTLIFCNSYKENAGETLVHFAIETGALLIDGFGNGIFLHDYSKKSNAIENQKITNSISFGILQASRTRISKTEYISCPSCGRTLFDLQETTANIRAVTNHLKGIKIGIMGCIVNGPGEMADADFGYVGSGPGKITLYKGKEVVKRNIPAEIAVGELIMLLKENNAWIEPEIVLSN